MIRQQRIIYRCIIDVNTQRDLFVARGPNCIRNHSRILFHIRRVMAWARANNYLVISICRVCPLNNFSYTSYRKISYTTLYKRFTFPITSSTDIPVDILSLYQQIVLYSRLERPFGEPLIERLLSEARIEESIVIGAVLEQSVCNVVLNLLHRGKKVILIRDAVGGYGVEARKMCLLKMKEKGAKIVETKEIAGNSHLKKVGACDCFSCQKKKGALVY